jgi:putative tricarboxylic transport membrane protein
MPVLGFAISFALLAWFIVKVMCGEGTHRARVAIGGARSSTGSSTSRSTSRSRAASSSRRMDIVSGLLHGFQVALTAQNLMMCVIGVVLGTVIGVLPGWARRRPSRCCCRSPSSSTHGRDDHARRHLLRREVRRLDHVDPPQRAGRIVVGGDVHRRAQDGDEGDARERRSAWRPSPRSSRAPSASSRSCSWRPPLAKLSLAFSAPEYFALMVLGLAMVVLLSGESLVKALLAMLVGLWIATMGTDLFSTTSRFTFDRVELLGGIDFIIVAIGVFAVGEVLGNMEPARRPRCCPCPRA